MENKIKVYRVEVQSKKYQSLNGAGWAFRRADGKYVVCHDDGFSYDWLESDINVIDVYDIVSGIKPGENHISKIPGYSINVPYKPSKVTIEFFDYEN